MADRWTIDGVEFATCNRDWGCPCQFGAPTTHGHCEAIVCGHIDEGHFNDTSLDGLDWALLVSWLGEIAEGNGTQQAIIHRAGRPRAAGGPRKILHGESTTPGATHFFVYNSTMTSVLETLYAPIELSIDVDERIADVTIEGMVESTGRPIISKFSGEPVRSRIDLPNGFEYMIAEMGNGITRVRAGIELDLTNTYGQFNVLHMNQDGVIR